MNYVISEPKPVSADDQSEIALLRNENLRNKTLPVFINAESQTKTARLFAPTFRKLVRRLSRNLAHGTSGRLRAAQFVNLLPKNIRNYIISSLAPMQSSKAVQVTYNLDIGFGLPTSNTPAISIVIPVFNQWWVTYRCLRAIQCSTNTTPFEVIVVDDYSSDQTSQALRNVRGIKVISNLSNQGYLESTNIGASIASPSSQYIALLNNDTEPIGNWLDELLNVFLNNENVAIVGSTLFYPNGQMQESGSQIFKTGNGYNIGKGSASINDMYLSLREVDYCSAASILIKKDFWLQAKGFDPIYKPAYYEDTDLAMSAWAAGLKVYICPKSWVIHHEGVSHGTSTSSGIKKHQVINSEKFVAKWGSELESHWTDNGYPRVEYARNSKGIIVLCDRQLPHQARDSGSQRTIRIAQRLIALGYHVVLTAIDTSSSHAQLEKLRESGIEIQLDRDSLLESLRFRRERISHFWLIREEVYDFYRDSLIEINETVPVIGDLLDLRYEDQTLGKIAKRHLEISRESDVTILVSPKEALELESVTKVKVYDLWYDFEVHKTEYSTANRSGILFVGGFRHVPNINGIYWFAEYVLPELKKLNFSEAINVVGSGLSSEQSKELSELGLIIHGFQPELDSHYNSAKAVIVPLVDGAGLKGKLAEALSYGVPTVTTTIGAEGFKLSKNGEHPFVISDDPVDYAHQLFRIASDRNLAAKYSNDSFEYVVQHLSENAMDTTLNALIGNKSLRS